MMYLRQRSALALALVLSACASPSSRQQDAETLNGQPIQPALAKLGAPDAQQKVDGGMAYIWTVQTRVDVPARVTETEYAAGRPNTFDTMRMEPRMQSCTLRLVVDGAGIIRRTEQDGPYQACDTFSRKLLGDR